MQDGSEPPAGVAEPTAVAPHVHRTHRVPQVAGALVAAAGAVALAGWWLDLRPLAALLPGWPPARPNTALALILGGLALACAAPAGASAPRRRRAAIAAACLMAAIGLLIAAQHVVALDLGIDGILVAGKTTLGGEPAGLRPPLVTAIGLTLLGAALVLRHLGGAAPAAAQALLVMTAAVSALPLIDDALTNSLSPIRESAGGLSLLTTLAALTLSAGALWPVPMPRATARAHRLRQAVPATLALFAALVWLIARAVHGGAVGPSTGAAGIAVTASLVIGLALWSCARLIARSEEELDRFFSLAPDVFCIVDFTGRIRRINDAASRILGWPTEELRARTYLDLVHPDDRDATRAEIEGLLADRPSRGFENRYACRGGGWRWVSWNAWPHAAHGRIYVVGRDVTEARHALGEIGRLTTQLSEMNDAAQEATRRKSAFLASMSHELRTPLNSIIGFAELMHDGRVGPVSADHREYLGDILASARHLLHIVNGVLDLAKVEAGKMEFTPEPVSPAAVAREVADLLRWLAAPKQIAIAVEADPALDVVSADAAKLKQVLYNYLSNAIKFTDSGGRVTVRTRREGADAFRLEVEDTGVGIPPDELPRLFQEYVQLDRAAGPSGTGLGLAVTRRLVEAQGGRVGVRSTPGLGSTFFALLPIRPGLQVGAATT